MKRHMNTKKNSSIGVTGRTMRLLMLLSLLTAGRGVVTAQEIPALLFSGFLRVENFTYWKGFDPNVADNGRNQIKFVLKGKSEVSDDVRMATSIEFRYDEVNPARNRTFLKEAFLEYSTGKLDVRAGKQIYSWGRADEVNPTNNLNPVDFSDILDTEEEEIGVVSCSGKYYLNGATLEIILAPVLVPSAFPANNSRWNLFPAAITSMEVRKPTNELKNWQAALRVSSSFNGWDFSLSYFRGWDVFPSVFVQPDTATASLSAILDYRRLQVAGADLATTVDKLTVRGEVGYFRTDDPNGLIPEVSDPYIQYVVGADYTLTDIIGDQDWFILAQWIQELRVPEYAGGEFSDNDLRHLFQRTVMVKTEWRFTEFSRFSIQGFYRLKASDVYLQPKFSTDLTDGLNLELGADLLAGKQGSFLNGLERNRRIFGKLTYQF